MYTDIFLLIYIKKLYVINSGTYNLITQHSFYNHKPSEVLETANNPGRRL